MRCAKALEEEAPLLLECIREISIVNLPKAESRLHPLIRGWGLAVPLDLYIFMRGLLAVPMIRPSQWFEYLLCRKSSILLGGFETQHPATPGFLRSFWEAYRGEEPQHRVFQDHPSDLDKCVPYFLFNDEGRGHRKRPLQIVALETVFSVSSFEKFEKLKAHPSTWTSTMFQEIQQHTVKGSSYTSRILLYVLPHNLYKGKKNRLWDLVMDTVTRDMEQLFHHGVQVDGTTFYPVLIGAKGDSPALIKLFKLDRSFTRWQGKVGVCPFCLAGQPGFPGKTSQKQQHGGLPATQQGHGPGNTHPALQLCRFQMFQSGA